MNNVNLNPVPQTIFLPKSVRNGYFCVFSFLIENHIFPTSRKLNKNISGINIREIGTTVLDASSSPHLNHENRTSFSCSYRKLFKKYSHNARATKIHAKKTDLIEIMLL